MSSGKRFQGLKDFYCTQILDGLKSLGRYIERRNGSKGYWTKDKILSLTVQKIKNHYTGDYTFHLFCKVGYNGKRINLNIRRLVYSLFVDSTPDERIEIPGSICER